MSEHRKPMSSVEALLEKNKELQTHVDELQKKIDTVVGHLQYLYQDYCTRYGTPVKNERGTVTATNGFMSSAEDILPMMSTLGVLPEPWEDAGE